MKFLSGTSLGCIATMFATLTLHATSAGAADAVTLTAPSKAGPILYLVDPFLFAKLDNGGNQKNLDLTVLYQKHNMPAVRAAALDADNTSAAIAVVQSGNPAADVTLSTNNGTTLLPYDPKFLTKAPSGAGTTTLTIPAAQLVKVGSKYYAAALVQAPAVGAAYDVANPITVTARQNEAAPPVKMALDVPPVILVHGLWGDKSSLQDLRKYLLTSPQWRREKLVDAICYSPFLAFDAAKDPLTNGSDPCEVTSQTALDRQIEFLMATLDKRHVVGGRVDVVAHSMGGLTIRHYSGLSEYRLPRNRNQGVFHQVVTLDTPELGSTLATYLINHADATRHASTGSSAWNLWEAECDDGDTVRSCFSKLGLPLAGDSQPLSTGSVYSLIPNGRNLKAAPGPRIPGTIWRAVTSTWPQRDKTSSLLRSVLNTLIRAIYNDNQTAPSTSSILETQNNDVIVRTASQLGGAPVSYNFTDLAHTRTPDASVFSTFFDGVTQNVEQNESVNNLVGCWLANDGAATCKPANLERPATLAAANTAPQLAKFGAFDRLSLAAPAQTPQLGVPLELPLHFASGIAHTIVVSQSDGHGEIESASGKATVARQAAGTSYVRVTPQRIGPMTFTVAASFADGGVAVKRIAVDVRPPTASPTAFAADNSPVVIVLDSAEPVAMLHPEATYPGIGTIPVDPRLLTTSVQQSGAPVIQMKGGMIQALRAGEATVDVRYGGAVDHVQVIVKPTWE